MITLFRKYKQEKEKQNTLIQNITTRAYNELELLKSTKQKKLSYRDLEKNYDKLLDDLEKEKNYDLYSYIIYLREYNASIEYAINFIEKYKNGEISKPSKEAIALDNLKIYINELIKDCNIKLKQLEIYQIADIKHYDHYRGEQTSILNELALLDTLLYKINMS